MHFIPLEELHNKQRIFIRDFLKKHESICVQLISNTKHNLKNTFAVFTDEVCAQNLYGILCMRKTILHCLPFANSEQESALQAEFIQSFADFFTSTKLEPPLCINGTAPATNLILAVLGKIGLVPAVKNDYFLLKCNTKKLIHKNQKTILPKNVKIVRCKQDMPADFFAQLQNLQQKYEKEEVVPPHQTFNEDSCRLKLKNALRTQYVLALLLEQTDSKTLVAKGGTNAVGFNFVQLGGIYTLPEFRGNHFARFILLAVLQHALRLKKQITLFVKQKNTPALSLYKSLEFEKITDYVIAYF